jgi:hypothetical protein
MQDNEDAAVTMVTPARGSDYSYVAVSALAGTSPDRKTATDSTALPFRMFGAHCVALRLSLNVIPVSD